MYESCNFLQNYVLKSVIPIIFYYCFTLGFHKTKKYRYKKVQNFKIQIMVVAMMPEGDISMA